MKLNAEKRELQGRSTDALRAEGVVPGVMYGFETEPVNIQLDRNSVKRAIDMGGESTVTQLVLDGAEHPVLIQEVQKDALTGFITHVDFRRVNMNEKVEAAIAITLTGEAPAVKSLGGTLMQLLEEVEVKALPSALVGEIEVSVEALNTFDDTIRVADITIPEGIEVLTDGEQAIASVQAPRTQEEMEALDEEVVVPEVEGAADKAEESTDEKSE